MGVNVLIVDDSKLIRQVITKVLKQVQLDTEQILEAEHGGKALEIVKGQRVDLILSDINMPEIDGLEMLRQLNAADQSQNIPVIMISTEGSEDTMQEAIRLGARGYVLKPFTPERLAEQLEPLGLLNAAGPSDQDQVDLSDPDAF